MYEGKYLALFEFLKRHKDLDSVTVSFTRIEEILNFKLPVSAFKYSAWWANEQDGNHSHARAWLEVGWKTSEVVLGGSVTFYNQKR